MATDNATANKVRRVNLKTVGRNEKAARNGTFYLSLIDERQSRIDSKELNISNWINFKKWSEYEIFLPGIPENFGRVVEIEVRQKVKGDFREWFLEWIKVTNGSNEKDSIFPCHRWIRANVPLRVTEFDAVLPQHDLKPQARKEELKKKKNWYSTEQKIQNWPLPQVKELPENEKFSLSYGFKLVSKVTEGSYFLKILSIAGDVFGRGKGYDGIKFHYKSTFKVPDAAQGDAWQSDEAFGQQRLNRCNVTQIRLCKEIPDKFAVDGDMLKPFLGEFSLEDALSNKRLYIVDYKILEDLPCGGNRRICAPIGLFFVNARKQLVPIAIQLFQARFENLNPVFLPSDDEYTWLLAKMWFNNADASYHQSCTHLGFTHLLMEAICLATHRSLSPSHPIFRLLAPHFLYLLAINSQAIKSLIAPGGWVDKSMSIGCKGMFELMGRQIRNWRLDVQGSLPKDLEERGVDDPNALPNYYYRDDALLYYNAIQKYVEEVVENFCQSQNDVKEDYEIQEWARCLSDPVDKDGVGIPGVHGGGKFESTEEIVDLCTSIIFIASVGHAAANFSQYEDYGFPPNYPAFLSGSPIQDKQPRTDDVLNATIPPKSVILDTMVITRALSTKATNQLGKFEVEYLLDEKSRSAAKRFCNEIGNIEKIIRRRNAQINQKYIFLLPENVPNAISI